MKAILSINGTEPAVQPLVDGYSVTEFDLLSSGSGRSSETGRPIRHFIRRLLKINLKFKGTPEQIAQVEALVSAFTQTVTFLYNGGYVTKDMYPGDRNVTTNGYVSELTVNLIEL